METAEYFRLAVQRIRDEHRQATGKRMTYAELEEKTGIAQRYIGDFLRGEVGWSEEKRRELAAGLGRDYVEMIKLGESIALLDEAREKETITDQNYLRGLNFLEKNLKRGDLTMDERLHQGELRELLAQMKSELDFYRTRTHELESMLLNPRRRGSR